MSTSEDNTRKTGIKLQLSSCNNFSCSPVGEVNGPPSSSRRELGSCANIDGKWNEYVNGRFRNIVTLTQSSGSCDGRCVCGWSYRCSSTRCDILGHGIRTNPEGSKPNRKLRWSNGIEYREVPPPTTTTSTSTTTTTSTSTTTTTCAALDGSWWLADGRSFGTGTGRLYLHWTGLFKPVFQFRVMYDHVTQSMSQFWNLYLYRNSALILVQQVV